MIEGQPSRENLEIDTTLSNRDINLLSRLPSVKQRHIDIKRVMEHNSAVVARSRLSGKILLVTFYHVFEDFVYTHTTIGRDEYKKLLFRELFKITTGFAPTYCILFGSNASIRATQNWGGEEVYLNQVDPFIPDFIEKIRWLTGYHFYRQGDVLMDHDDVTPIKNPIFRITDSAYKKSLQ